MAKTKKKGNGEGKVPSRITCSINWDSEVLKGLKDLKRREGGPVSYYANLAAAEFLKKRASSKARVA